MKYVSAFNKTMNRSFTVVIPTVNRPSMLLDALASVDNQSIKNIIELVLVSENSEYGESRLVVDRFVDALPVFWIQQPTPLSPNIHSLHLSQMVKTTHVALLSDDDIWDRYHLEEACRAFDLYPGISSFFGQAVVVENSNCQVLQRFGGTFDQSHENTADQHTGIIRWDQPTTALNLISSTINIWACVATTAAYQEAMRSAVGHPKYGSYPASDIFYIWRLSFHGDIAVGRHISLFYRRHATSHMQTAIRQDATRSHEQTLAIRKEICRQAEQLGFDPLSLWRDAYIRLAHQHLAGGLPPMYAKHYRWLVSGGKEDSSSALLWMRWRDRFLAMIRILTPPIFFILLRKSSLLK